MTEKVDVVIVGAGPAGCAAAYSLAKMGYNVVMVERGKYAGAKNVIGGRMYSHALNRLIPNFWKEAPVERQVVREKTTFLCDQASVTIDFQDKELLDPPNSFTLLRAKFDKWFADKAVEVGATLIPNIRVDSLFWKDKKIAGVVAGPDTLEANVVIAADGATSFMAEKAGLTKFQPSNFAIGMKEIIELPESVIEDRFNLSGEEGAAQLLIGHCTKGIVGGGFIYTNRSSVSLGLVVNVSHLIEGKVEAHELIRQFNMNPLVENLIDGGKIVEYSAHLVPEVGGNTKLFTDGLLAVGDAGGLLVNSGVTIRGMDFAIASGIAAAETLKHAFERNDFSKKSLSDYEYRMKKDFVLRDKDTFKRVPEFLLNSRLYSLYPDLICRIFHRMALVDGEKDRIYDIIKEETKGKTIQILSDLIRGARAL
jgi:electron transfer flavoprotein-quinone oxidoreductase